MRNRAFCLILVFILSGLGWAAKDYVFTPEEQGVVTPQIAFDPDLAKQALGPGTCSLKGIAFEERSGGKRPIPSDSTIYLFPYTPYCQEVVKLFREYSVPPVEKSMEEVMLESQCPTIGVSLPEFLPVKRVEVDPSFPKIWRKTKTDKLGNFVFDHLKPGRYYLQSPTFMVAKNEHWKEKVGENVQEYWWSDGVVTTDYTPVYENRQTMVLRQLELVGVFELSQPGEVRQIELNEDWHDFQAP